MAERQLVDRCLAGEAAAWTELYDRCHGPLLRAICAILGSRTSDSDLVEEIGARVWYAVVANNGELLSRFDANRGCRLTTYLSVIARDMVSRHFRSERRRRKREMAVSGPPVTIDQLDENLTEFVKLLTPAEREFFVNVLLADPAKALADDYSPSNTSQLRFRIRNKLKAYTARS